MSYTPRIIFDCTPEQLQRSQRLFTQKGLRTALLRKVFDDILDMMEQSGEVFASALAFSSETSLTCLPRCQKAAEITNHFLERIVR